MSDNDEKPYALRIAIWSVFFVNLPLVCYCGIRCFQAVANVAEPTIWTFLMLVPVIFVNLGLYMNLAARPFKYSILGSHRPRRTPRNAWAGVRVESHGQIGGLRGSGFYWSVSDLGIAVFVPGIISGFVPWTDITIIVGYGKDKMCSISHEAPDIRSPIFCPMEEVGTVISRLAPPFLVSETTGISENPQVVLRNTLR